MPKTTHATPNGLDAGVGPAEQTGPIGRVVRVLLEVGFVYGFGTLVDQGGPAAVRDPDTITGDAPFVLLTIAMVALYAVLVSELAKIVAGEAVAKRARSVALVVLGAAAAVAAIVGEVRSGAVWGSPLADLGWALDAAIVLQTIIALPIAVVLGTPGWRSASGATSPPASAVGRPRRRSASSASTTSTSGSSVANPRAIT